MEETTLSRKNFLHKLQAKREYSSIKTLNQVLNHLRPPPSDVVKFWKMSFAV
jgi:hypothetical protein